MGLATDGKIAVGWVKKQGLEAVRGMRIWGFV